MSKQTAVEWIFERINMFCMFTDGVPDEWQEALEQAKQMEKEVIMNAYTSGEHQQGFEQEAEQYYNETFKAKEK